MPASHTPNSEGNISATDTLSASVTATTTLGPVSGFSKGIANVIPAIVVTNFTGLTSIAAKLQQSQDGTNWFDIGSGGFTTATGNTTQQLAALTGPFDDQIRVSLTVVGTGSATVTVELTSQVTDNQL